MKLYIGNLSYSTDTSKLEEIFGEFGEVDSAQIITDRDTGRSKGFGFIEMPDDEAAKAAIEQLHDTDIDGRNVTVNEARPREDRRGGGGGFRGGNRGGGGGYGGGNRY